MRFPFKTQPKPAQPSAEVKTVALSPLTALGLSPVILAKDGVYSRRAPFFLDTEYASSTTRAAIDQYFKVLKQNHQAVRLVTLPQARITGQGAVITADNRMLKESVVEFTARGKAPDGLTAAGTDTYTLPNRVDREIDLPCILVKRPWYANYGHWLVDGATVLAMAAETIRTKDLTVVIGRYSSPKMRAVVLDTINQLAPGANVLQHPDAEIWRFKELYYVTPPHVPPLFKSPEALSRVRVAFTGMLDNVEPRRRLFLTRRTAATRHIVNEPELFELCAARGFEMAEPEKLPLIDQTKLFAEAAMVIGPKGAALTNCMFCGPNAKTMVLTPSDFPDPFFWDVSARRGDYGEVFGRTVTQKPAGLNEFTIEPSRLTAMLDAAGA